MTFPIIKSRTVAAGATLITVLLFVLLLHGAVPFLAMPTLGQAVWTTGFAQSFLNDSVFSVYAINFGAPRPAPIVFGLAGAWPVALLIDSGLHPADAYSAMVALWLGIACLSAYSLARLLRVSPLLSVLGAVLWLTMPMIWVHADYSMLSLGIALLPFYFLCALALLLREGRLSISSAACASLYVLACLIAVFMDGYTFVMFALGGSVLGGWLFIHSPASRRSLLQFALPVHLIGVGVACGLYLHYVGVASYQAAPLENFRAWGLDLAFLAVPTQGVHWIPDVLGLSKPRSEEEFFGDASVWSSTFALPLLLAAFWAWWRARGSSGLAGGCMIILLVSFYMALGPSLKVHATKPAGHELGQLMPARYATAPTGSAWLSRRVPGLRNMRAPYRWLALSVFSGWCLLMLAASSGARTSVVLTAAVVGVVALINLPDMGRKWADDKRNREMFLRIDSDLLEDMRLVIKPGERVAFLPYRNDFLVNYLAARLDIVSFNIGGDKNLEEARRYWPEIMREFHMGSVDEGFERRVMQLLAHRHVDSVVLPYVDMLWAAHRWPMADEFREVMRSSIATMRESNFVEVIERQHYAVVRLVEGSARPQSGVLNAALLREVCMPPVCLMQGGSSREAARGFLRLGPPRSVVPGRFHVAIYGTADASAQGWVDVVSGQATVRHARLPLAAPKISPGGIGVLAEGQVTLESMIPDLQIHVFVGEDDVVRIDGYELVPIRR